MKILEIRKTRNDRFDLESDPSLCICIPLLSFFELNMDIRTRTRGHSLKLVKHRCHFEMRCHFFSEKVINRYNKLDQNTVSASNVNRFKSRLEQVLQQEAYPARWSLLTPKTWPSFGLSPQNGRKPARDQDEPPCQISRRSAKLRLTNPQPYRQKEKRNSELSIKTIKYGQYTIK